MSWRWFIKEEPLHGACGKGSGFTAGEQMLSKQKGSPSQYMREGSQSFDLWGDSSSDPPQPHPGSNKVEVVAVGVLSGFLQNKGAGRWVPEVTPPEPLPTCRDPAQSPGPGGKGTGQAPLLRGQMCIQAWIWESPYPTALLSHRRDDLFPFKSLPGWGLVWPRVAAVPNVSSLKK